MFVSRVVTVPQVKNDNVIKNPFQSNRKKVVGGSRHPDGRELVLQRVPAEAGHVVAVAGRVEHPVDVLKRRGKLSQLKATEVPERGVEDILHRYNRVSRLRALTMRMRDGCDVQKLWRQGVPRQHRGGEDDISGRLVRHGDIHNLGPVSKRGPVN